MFRVPDSVVEFPAASVAFTVKSALIAAGETTGSDKVNVFTVKL